MKAMILAAGRGERMRPLTDKTPKPLLTVGGKPLIEYHLERLANIGVEEVVINVAYLGEQIQAYLGSSFQNKLAINYSPEPKPLETAGAILHAAALLGNEPFILINGDVWTDYPLALLLKKNLDKKLAHLVLVENPVHNSLGDFSIDNNLLISKKEVSYTFSGISIISPELIHSYPKAREVFPLGEVFKAGIENKIIGAEFYSGQWFDIGTVERLMDLDERLKK